MRAKDVRYVGAAGCTWVRVHRTHVGLERDARDQSGEVRGSGARLACLTVGGGACRVGQAHKGANFLARTRGAQEHWDLKRRRDRGTGSAEGRAFG